MFTYLNEADVSATFREVIADIAKQISVVEQYESGGAGFRAHWDEFIQVQMTQVGIFSRNTVTNWIWDALAVLSTSTAANTWSMIETLQKLLSGVTKMQVPGYPVP
jgi:hypothetical protein